MTTHPIAEPHDSCAHVHAPLVSIRTWCWRLAFVGLVLASAAPALADDTGTIGGSGGGVFRLTCPNGQFLVGVTGRSGEWMDMVAPVCATPGAAGRWTGPPSLGQAAGGSGGGPFTTMCPQDSVVVGFSGYSDKYVFNIGLYCRRRGPKDVERLVASPRLVGGTLDIGSSAGFDCRADQAANGLVGRSGIYVDRFGLSCAGYVDSAPAPAPSRPPVGDRATTSVPVKGPVPALFHWSSRTFPPPNGGLLVFAIMPDGNPACASYDGASCLWGVPPARIDHARLKPLVCGEAHRARWGVTGFEDPRHWCSLARRNP